ncbi:hypothetical protein SASPL_101441 [Salvia splendens]|uniref:Uncharacterized protein n=1 Tax=Salvia splendens TaxID=180675 RepID=A0A8X8YRQ1_SALSN|nr:hypothetical protein SASPL_101441 [Salvia splendens]
MTIQRESAEAPIVAESVEAPIVAESVEALIEENRRSTSADNDGGLIFNSATIEKMEMLILAALKWQMRSVNPFSFLNYFISLFDSGDDERLIQALKKEEFRSSSNLSTRNQMIASTRGGWAIEASIGAVEALKDQLGVCRWNYVIRSVEQRAKSIVQTYYHKHVVSPASPAGAPSGSRAPAGNMLGLQERAERREQRVKKVMDLSCGDHRNPIQMQFKAEEEGDGGGGRAAAKKQASKDWESMSLSEKAVGLYVGEKGLVFWLTNWPTHPSSS